jgi:pyridoxine 5'-phosphate synthase PdxJ
MDTCASTVTLFVGRDANIRIAEGISGHHIEIYGGRYGAQHIGSLALDGATREQAVEIARAIERAVGAGDERDDAMRIAAE